MIIEATKDVKLLSKLHTMPTMEKSAQNSSIQLFQCELSFTTTIDFGCRQIVYKM